jgi:glutamate racemase
MANNNAIAVLDTGAGGLSVVRPLRSLAPCESIHYFADYAHVPYGLKSPELIRHLGFKAARKLVDLSDCKLLVVACHTMSVCLDLKELSDKLKVPVIGMLKPSILGLERLLSNRDYKSFGIVSTRATIISGAYRKFWSQIDKKGRCALVEHACGSLASLVEEGINGEEELRHILYGLLPLPIKSADAVLLGCTHFSALSKAFKRVLSPNADLIDAGDLVAREVLLKLEAQGGLSLGPKTTIKAYVSDNVERFCDIAQRFIDEPMSVTLVRDELL